MAKKPGKNGDSSEITVKALRSALLMLAAAVDGNDLSAKQKRTLVKWGKEFFAKYKKQAMDEEKEEGKKVVAPEAPRIILP